MVFFEALNALVSFDLQWFLNTIIDHIVWVFMFYAILHYLTEGKHTVFYFLLFAPYLWIFVDFNDITGLAWHGAIGLALWFVLRLFVTAFGEKTPFISRNFTAIWIVVAFSNILFNTFIRAW